jgi:hypothetical protein
VRQKWEAIEQAQDRHSPPLVQTPALEDGLQVLAQPVADSGLAIQVQSTQRVHLDMPLQNKQVHAPRVPGPLSPVAAAAARRARDADDEDALLLILSQL